MFAVCVSAVLLAGCGLFDSSAASSVETVTLAAVLTSGETGTATLTDLGNGTTQIAIATSGGTDTGVQSAVIRSGACGGSSTIFAELNNLQGGQSITTLQYALSSLTGGQYDIEVNSSTNVDQVATCGDIE